MKILISGGAGFIGSTVASAAADAGHQPVILDNLSTGREEFTRDYPFYRGDISDAALVERVFDEHPDIACAVHCAAMIVVPDSVADPVSYYRVNVSGTLDFVDSLIAHGVTRMIFSSSGSVYEASREDFSVDENSAVNPTNPYSRTKAVVEGMLADIANATGLRVLSLRYFNPIGADPQMRTGLALKTPSHALGMLVNAHQSGATFQITGNDYPTPDGTGIRDYIHVWDLALAHVQAIERFDTVFEARRHQVINLGVGQGTTVAELVAAFNRVVDTPVTVTYGPRRPGDSAGAWTKSQRARDLLGWTAQRSLEQGITDTLRWFEVRPTVLPDLS